MRLIINPIYTIPHGARIDDSVVLVQEDSWDWICPHEPMWLWSLEIPCCWPTVIVSAHSPPKRKLTIQGISEQWYSTEDSTGSLRTSHHTPRVSALPGFPRHRPPPLLLHSDNRLLLIQHRHQRGKRQTRWIRLSNRGFSKLGTGKKR